jgi:hypothetical protein
MDRRKRLPFQDLTTDNWLNLALASLLALFLFYFVLELALGRLCGQVGVDYCDYWSAGQVATTYGHAAVYDLELLDRVQKSILPADADRAAIRVVPFPYLPVFVLPFQLFALLPPAPGFILWTLLNLAAFWLYMGHLTRRLRISAPSTRLNLMLLASLPMFLNLFSGQVSVWLTICAGQFMLGLMDRKPMRAGWWLGGFVLKPQLLLLIVPILLLQRSFRVLAGLAICSVLVGATSIALIGAGGLLQMLALWQDYAAGRASNWIEGMMNFRMLGLQLSLFVHAWAGWGLAAAGMLTVIGLSLHRWRLPFDPPPTSIATGILGILAATVTVAWHSHIHMAMILLPPMILLLDARVLPTKAFNYWVLLPSFLYVLAVFLPPALVRLRLISNPGAPFVYLPFAGAQLICTLYLFWWALRRPREGL